jgi:hypothetical protein
MIVYRNKFFKKRNPEVTNIVAAVVLDEAAYSIPAHYELADESILQGLTPLWIQNRLHYYGYL